jgi:hypothetical protein
MLIESAKGNARRQSVTSAVKWCAAGAQLLYL